LEEKWALAFFPALVTSYPLSDRREACEASGWSGEKSSAFGIDVLICVATEQAGGF